MTDQAAIKRALKRVERAADRLDAARSARDQAMCDAHGVGASFRGTARAARTSYEWARKIITGAA